MILGDLKKNIFSNPKGGAFGFAKTVLVWGGATLGFIFYIQSHFYFNFENVSAHIVTIILNIPELSKLLHFAWVWAEKMAKNKMETILLDTRKTAAPIVDYLVSRAKNMTSIG